MGLISTVDIQTRLDICELLSRYCHFVDHDAGDDWAALFTRDGIFEVPGSFRLEGREQLSSMPRIVQDHGKGLWRHQITNILIDHSLNRKEMSVKAYGLVTDWGNGGTPISFSDYDIILRHSCHWQITHLKADTMMRQPSPVLA